MKYQIKVVGESRMSDPIEATSAQDAVERWICTLAPYGCDMNVAVFDEAGEFLDGFRVTRLSSPYLPDPHYKFSEPKI